MNLIATFSRSLLALTLLVIIACQPQDVPQPTASYFEGELLKNNSIDLLNSDNQPQDWDFTYIQDAKEIPYNFGVFQGEGNQALELWIEEGTDFPAVWSQTVAMPFLAVGSEFRLSADILSYATEGEGLTLSMEGWRTSHRATGSGCGGNCGDPEREENTRIFHSSLTITPDMMIQDGAFHRFELTEAMEMQMRRADRIVVSLEMNRATKGLLHFDNISLEVVSAE
ncbi:MAG: hypothetical protein AAF206_03190 [Bacteroidota bacterium]